MRRVLVGFLPSAESAYESLVRWCRRRRIANRGVGTARRRHPPIRRGLAGPSRLAMVLVAKFVASSQIRLPAQPHLTTRVGPWRAGVVLGPLCEYHRSSQPQASGSSVRIDRRPADVAIERTNCWCRSPLGGGSRANRGGLREMRRPVRSWRLRDIIPGCSRVHRPAVFCHFGGTVQFTSVGATTQRREFAVKIQGPAK
jgi:hypothetical protein